MCKWEAADQADADDAFTVRTGVLRCNSYRFNDTHRSTEGLHRQTHTHTANNTISTLSGLCRNGNTARGRPPFPHTGSARLD